MIKMVGRVEIIIDPNLPQSRKMLSGNNLEPKTLTNYWNRDFRFKLQQDCPLLLPLRLENLLFEP